MDAHSIVDGIDGITYLTKPDGTILMVGRRHWNRFARNNGGAALLDGASVIGHNLFDFISGPTVRAAYERACEMILCRRATRMQLVSRCDSPSVERELLITVTPVFAGEKIDGLLWQSLTISETARPPVDLFDFAALRARLERERNVPILTMCSYCQQVRYPIGSSDADGEWISAPEYYRRGGGSRVRISHGLCEHCLERAEEALVA